MRLIPGARVLLRGDGALQVGIRHPVILHDLSTAERRFLERLDTTGHCSAADQERYAEVMARLSGAGLVTPDSSGTDLPALWVALNDGGPVGVGMALALARAGWAVVIDDDGAAVQSPRGTYDPGSLATTRQAAAADTVRRILPHAAVHAGQARSDIAVLVWQGAPLTQAAVPLMARDTPHLYVTTDEHGVRVGPLVIPGQSACGICVGLEQVLADPQWPLLALQLTASRALPHSTPDVVAQAVALVTGALGWWRSTQGDTPPVTAAWTNTVWEVDHHTPPRTMPTPPHPECGCGAAGPVGDELAARRARMPRGE